uniref:Uncharacterized protein n=1 Tax=Schlesneria paludicola TaxID=360056 RepID=A0A7C2K0N4_9PLAN
MIGPIDAAPRSQGTDWDVIFGGRLNPSLTSGVSTDSTGNPIVDLISWAIPPEQLAEPLGVTDTQPFWSEDRQQFVVAGRLRVGERLRNAAGEPVRIARIAPRSGPRAPVHNLVPYPAIFFR